MLSEVTSNMSDMFNHYLSVLTQEFPYVEDSSFSWDNVVAILIIQLKNTDSLNKERAESHATQIQLTSERDPSDVIRKTEDFFPTLTLNSSFKSWRISIPTRINLHNIEELGGPKLRANDAWQLDSIQIRRRLLNDDGQGGGNPNLQICYGNDLMPLREQLMVDDYLVIVKHKAEAVYDAFGVKKTADLGNGKNLYISDQAKTDITTFNISDLTANYDEKDRKIGGSNVLYYGVPGAGKSHKINQQIEDFSKMERVVFHPDYTYSDFVGQILPQLIDVEGSSEKKLTYEFIPGPFTRMLKKALADPENMYYLVIEEINRGNAPAIFGEIFQLLDRLDTGEGEYAISNNDVAMEIYGDKNHFIKMPSNFSIFATMNTSDQNVFTLDTAFQRRWDMRQIRNDLDAASHSAQLIEGSKISWGVFAEVINEEIIETNEDMISLEDKRLGAYFVKPEELSKERFPQKALKYLWDDAFKMDRGAVFIDKNSSLEHVLFLYETAKGDPLKMVLRADVYQGMLEKTNEKKGDDDKTINSEGED